MLSKKSYKARFEFVKRKLEANKIKEKYPDRVPIIVEVSDGNMGLTLDKNKYLCPGDLTCGQFMYIIRKRTSLSEEEALYMFCDDSLPATSMLISQLYKEKKDEDGFLYMIISKESTFGCS